jgi:hypothetical protein
MIYPPTQALELPVTPGAPDQSFTVKIGGIDCAFRIIWNTESGAWFCRITAVNGSFSITPFKLVCGIELATGEARNIGYVTVFDRKQTGEDPNFSEFGTRFALLVLS